jgi:hypothetical protein
MTMNSNLTLSALSATVLGLALSSGALAADNLAVVRDATTGELRAPTAEEAQALNTPSRSASSKGGPAQPLIRRHADGASSVRMTDEFATYAVAVRKANGSLQTQCFDSKDAAAAALSMSVSMSTSQAPATTNAQAATK